MIFLTILSSLDLLKENQPLHPNYNGQIHFMECEGIGNLEIYHKRTLRAHKDIDFLMLQEIKESTFQLDIALKCIWKDANPFSTNHERGRGGTTILISTKWKNLVVDWGLSPCNRDVWVMLNNQGKKFGVCLIYAPNDHMSRVSNWKWMSLTHNIY
jgi:exonuclease III